MKFSHLLMLFLTLFITPVFTSCDDDTELEETEEAGFQLTSTWTLRRVDVDGEFMGAAQSDTDNAPEGTITFSNGGVGTTAYMFTVFGATTGSAGAFVWTRDGDNVTVTESNGQVQNWNILEKSANRLEAEWEQTFPAGTTQVDGTIQIVLTK